MKFAYADPPYLGCGHLYDDDRALEFNYESRHEKLVLDLRSEYPDGFAVSCSSPSLRLYTRLMPEARVCAWTKPFASFKPNVTVAYCWEPVLLLGGRKRTREEPTVRDFLAENITLKKGLCGAKPLRFNQWILALLNWKPGDELIDIYPGTGGMARALELEIQDIGGPIKK
jgi:hypothetical protein